MIEATMFFALGFLVAAAVALVALPAVWNRAVRLTRRRIESLVPVSMAEIQADKDQLRAEFAMSARRLEINVENLKRRTGEQLAELGKKSEAIVRMKADIVEKDATVQALEAQEKALRDQLASTEEELTAKTRALREAETQLGEKTATLSTLQRSIEEKTLTADSQRVEIVALETQVVNLKDRVADLEKEVEATAARARRERDSADSLGRTLGDERGKVVALSSRIAELEAKLSSGAKDSDGFLKRIASLENELKLQDERLRTHDDAVASARREASDARLAETRAREEAERVRKSVEAETKGLRAQFEQAKAEKQVTESALAQAREDRSKLQREVAQLKRQAETSWSGERTENALLRERINDVAAEVARLTATLEGPASPITALVAESDTARPARATSATPSPAAVAGADRTLADRIRALQARTTRN